LLLSKIAEVAALAAQTTQCIGARRGRGE